MSKNAHFFIHKSVSWTVSHEFRACWLTLGFRRSHSAAWRKAHFRYLVTVYTVLIGGRYMNFSCPGCGLVSRIQYPYPHKSIYFD